MTTPRNCAKSDLDTAIIYLNCAWADLGNNPAARLAITRAIHEAEMAKIAVLEREEARA
ncbi:MAG: hypothetical protein KGL39_51425 [Patescibacteria group bacterium]|nr:hypothetical protein [Patescibacteria group bacterium]